MAKMTTHAGRGNASRGDENQTRKKSSRVVLKGYGKRLRDSRELLGLSRKDVSQSLGWSESRVISYENETTEPNGSEYAELGEQYGCDRAWLTFGDDYAMHLGVRSPGLMRGVWLPQLGGGQLPVPSDLVFGLPGPLMCAAVTESTDFGLLAGNVLILQTKAVPTAGDVWAIKGAIDGVRAGWMVSASRTTAKVRLDIDDGVVSVAVGRLLGRVVAMMKRTVCSTPDTPKRKGRPRQ